MKYGGRAAWRGAKIAFKLSKPLVRRRARRRAAEVRAVSRAVGESFATYAPLAARGAGLAEPAKRARTAPRIALGAVMGAGAVYLFEPERGRELRQSVKERVGAG
jgi:hypothetical protein